MYKDAGLGRDLARQAGVPMPLANLAHELYAFCIEGPGADRDYSYVSTRVMRIAAEAGRAARKASVARGRPRRA
jgi:hypothetical protein